MLQEALCCTMGASDTLYSKLNITYILVIIPGPGGLSIREAYLLTSMVTF